MSTQPQPRNGIRSGWASPLGIIGNNTLAQTLASAGDDESSVEARAVSVVLCRCALACEFVHGRSEIRCTALCFEQYVFVSQRADGVLGERQLSQPACRQIE